MTRLLRQVPHNINFREKKLKQSKKKSESAGGEEAGGARGRVARFRYFEDIYSYSGVSLAQTHCWSLAEAGRTVEPVTPGAAWRLLCCWFGVPTGPGDC